MRWISIVNMFETVGVLVYLGYEGARLHVRYVHKPWQELYRNRHFIVDNYAFSRGVSMRVDEYIKYLENLRRTDMWKLCDMVIAPDAVLDPDTTLRLHRHYIETASSDVLRKSACVVQEFRISRLVRYIKEMVDMGFRRVAVPSRNVTAMRMVPTFSRYFEHVHILGLLENAVKQVLKYVDHVDSLDTSSRGE